MIILGPTKGLDDTTLWAEAKYPANCYMKSSTCSCKNREYLASITDKSVITCDKIIDAETKTIPSKF